MAVILCYGDSNTHGTPPQAVRGAGGRLPRGTRWPEIMSAALGPGQEVIAEGLPGRTTVHDDAVEGGRRSGVDVLPAVLLSHVPVDLMILLLGTNDLKNRFAVTAMEIALSVERLVIEARMLVPGLPILVLSPIPVREAGALTDVFAGAEARQAGLAGHLAAVAERQGCAFLDLAPLGTVSDIDGVHWEADTHAAIGAALAETVRALLEPAP